MSNLIDIAEQWASEQTVRRISVGRKIAMRDSLAARIEPYMGETLQWLCSPRKGEGTRAYARRTAEYALMRLGYSNDVAVCRSVASVFCRR